MSRINAIRIINLNYNNNMNRISDETFYMNGENTLLTLDNGGGKSVLIQMVISPFVHKNYRVLNERPFAGFFTSSRPSFVMVEWLLDRGAGYVLTGMMVRRSPEVSEDGGQELDHLQFISFYHDSCAADIHKLPVVSREHGAEKLKSFQDCRQLFESFKAERSLDFYLYDMNQSSQARLYFEKLREFRIDYHEWESVIWRINRSESGLSRLFAESRNEKGLVEKWFLNAVDEKLNSESRRITSFQNIMEKYVLQYRDNRRKMENRDSMQAFLEEAEKMRMAVEECCTAEDAFKQSRIRIADLRSRLEKMRTRQEEALSAKEEELSAIRDRLSYLGYGSLSVLIRQLINERSKEAARLELLRAEMDSAERMRAEALRGIDIQECARRKEKVEAAAQRYEEAKYRLEMLLKEKGDAEPERRRLGGMLKGYYTARKDALCGEIEKLEEGSSRIRKEKKDNETIREEAEEEKRRILRRRGALESETAAYDKAEGSFNRRYGTGWRRNIAGLYEEGALSNAGKEYAEEEENIRRALLTAGKEADDTEQKIREAERHMEELQQKTAGLKSAAAEIAEKQESLRKQEEERFRILKHLGMDESHLYDVAEIRKTIDRCSRDADLDRSRQIRKRQDLEERLLHLKEGRMKRLEQAFADMLDQAEIRYVYGMEWLQKNGKSERENRKLVEQHPFLPYAILVSIKDLERIRRIPEPVCTESPVPLVAREALQQAGEGDGALWESGKVSFYLWFDKRLLSESKRKEIAEVSLAKIRELQEHIDRRAEEYREYTAMRERIEMQSLSREASEALLTDKEKNAEEQALTDKALRQCRDEREKLRKNAEELGRRIPKLKSMQDKLTRRHEDFEELCARYAEYDRQLEELESIKEEYERLNHRTDSLKKILSGLEEEGEKCAAELRNARYTMKETESSLSGYMDYELLAPCDEEGVAKAEGQYRAITERISAEQTILEQSRDDALVHLREAEDELVRKTKKCGLTLKDYGQSRYEPEQVMLLEQKVRESEKLRDMKAGEIGGSREQYVRLDEKVKQQYGKLKSEYDKEEILTEEETEGINFAEETGILNREEEQCRLHQEHIRKRLLVIKDTSGYLAEYNDLTEEEEAVWEKAPEEMDDGELYDTQTGLRREYRIRKEECLDKRQKLERIIDSLQRDERFSSEQYGKSLNVLRGQTEKPYLVRKQLKTSLASYRTQLQKLLVDLALLEKERDSIVNVLKEYLAEVHIHLGRIDANSTITIREHSVKMLKIILPDWQEQESVYIQRIGDLVDETAERCVEMLGLNQNFLEYLGTQLTTRSLYDAVVGTGNVQIRLYKIEKEREYPISWTEVAKNSGGEGFLSAFVILSALLYYARKDETDLFAESNESKVLIMDNPFAAANAAHLLIPMMEVARKTNVQLICLTGLGGDTIYDRFKNIYALSLISSNLRGGMQYLKKQHVRGSEERSVISARVEVAEQLSFLTE